MAIKKSISGMRGTIGGVPGENLTPIDIVEMTAAYAQWIMESGHPRKVVVGRDGRISGPLVSSLAINTLLSMGLDVVDLGLSTTPTVEMAVPAELAGGGIVFSASHNPKEWNALKLLNEKGEFISQKAGTAILKIAEKRNFSFAGVDDLGKLTADDNYIDYHIKAILGLKVLNVLKIKQSLFKVVVDCVNSTGAISLPPLLQKLGCGYELINAEMNGKFAHNPEPVPAHLGQLAKRVVETNADLGIAVDPDVDRLVLVCEDGSMFSEEYTIVAVSEFILSKTPGNTVSNLSSTRALADITKQYKGKYQASAVGEVHVVNTMKKTKAIIGGEGNGGVIYPELHYGRDALVGIAMILNLLADKKMTLSQLKETYPQYHIVKKSLKVSDDKTVKKYLQIIETAFKDEKLNKIDGLKIDWPDAWAHIRSSNTEPIIRIIAEAKSKEKAHSLVKKILNLLDGK